MIKQQRLPDVSQVPTPRELQEKRATIFKALGHPVRLLLMEALQQGEVCVCELAELAPQGLATVSKHLSMLRDLGIVRSRREGQKVYYALVMPCLLDSLPCVDRLLVHRADEASRWMSTHGGAGT